MEAAAAAVALASTGLFSGGVLYVSAIELPAALKYSYSCFSNYFSDMYPRGFKIQGSFLALGTAAAATAAAMAADRQGRLLWALSGALLVAVVPYTMLVHMPTTKRILSQEVKDPMAQSALLRRWGRLHHGRTVLSLSALAAMIAAVVCS